MTESEARMVLGVTSSADSEDIKEAYEEAVFEQASFFMRRVFISKLAKARIAKLEKVVMAAAALRLDTSEEEHSVMAFEFNSATNHQQVLERYNRAETQIKLALANTSSATEAIVLFRSWIELFEAYAKSFLSFCNLDSGENQVRLTEATIFVEYRNATEEEREELIRKECARLNRLQN
ncbi:MAG TPA: hypothetical protein VJ949_09500 [Cryomorphaceae bacterium]|nr:hypothetical protein [Cryomorphaceae bacterium]